jgi:hypothetical protein
MSIAQALVGIPAFPRERPSGATSKRLSDKQHVRSAITKEPSPNHISQLFNMANGCVALTHILSAERH